MKIQTQTSKLPEVIEIKNSYIIACKKKEMKIRGTLTNAPTHLCPVCPAAQIDKKNRKQKTQTTKQTKKGD